MVKRYLEWLKSKGYYAKDKSLEHQIIIFANEGFEVLMQLDRMPTVKG